MGKRAFLIVLDGLGIGEAPDTADFGDAGSDTLGNVARALGGYRLPFLERLGLGCCRPLAGMKCADAIASYGVALPKSQGKDSTTGHWEICELVIEQPFPTYPDGFPPDVIARFESLSGRKVIGNKAASGTAIIEELGADHIETGDLIVYTSADSVFQIAAHEEVVPLENLYGLGREAREMLQGEHGVSRVIVRPFVGRPGSFERTANRRDFSLEPPGDTLLDRLARAGIERVGVGKVDDLFANRSISSTHTPTNEAAYRLIEEGLREMDGGLLFANVIEFDQSWGHRNDVEGFRGGLSELDRRLPDLVDLLKPGDLMIMTADHGNDPTSESTDHSREAVPILAVVPGAPGRSLGERQSFADIGATVAEFFGLEPARGTSFLREITLEQ